jgi:hypothetical protein
LIFLEKRRVCENPESVSYITNISPKTTSTTHVYENQQFKIQVTLIMEENENAEEMKMKYKEEGLERYVTKDAPMGIRYHH